MDSATLTPPKSDLQQAAFAARLKHFGKRIDFFAPGLKRYDLPGFTQSNPRAFLPISLTGSGCALNCEHCDSKILEPMIALDPRKGLFDLCEKLAANGTEAILISGGSMKNGQVPFLKHITDISKVKAELGLKIIMHTGLVDEPMAAGLKKAGVDGVALDIIGADETIKEVYHLENSVEDFDRSLQVLSDYELSLRPHIILGLHYGQFLGENRALEMIAQYPIHALVLVILTPLHDTPMFGVEPPPVEEVEDFFLKSRMKMPGTKITLGCARPGGNYKQKTDIAAVKAGLNGIAYPAEGISELAKTMGLEPSYFENACSCGVE